MNQGSKRENVFVSGGFDDIRAKQIRFLEEASKLGPLTVILWSDETIYHQTGRAPKFTEAERLYFLEAIRFVSKVKVAIGNVNIDSFAVEKDVQPATWVVLEENDTPQKRGFCNNYKLKYTVLKEADLVGYTEDLKTFDNFPGTRKKVVVTGCFDWLHSGHVRFFEETSALGDLYVVLGHDENVLLLKGEGHPLFPQNERRYMVQSIRYVKQALVSTGTGWMDAGPEIAQIQPDMYAVNEDGDKPEKRAFCEANGIEYVVLKRLPKEGLPKRESTALRGF